MRKNNAEKNKTYFSKNLKKYLMLLKYEPGKEPRYAIATVLEEVPVV